MPATESTPATPEFSRPAAVETLLDGTPVEGEAGEVERAALAERFGLLSLGRLSFTLQARPWRGGLRLTGTVRAAAEQACVVTLAPVPVTIEEPVSRGFLPPEALPEYEPNAEYELADDPEIGEPPEPLTDPLDLGEIAAESLGLALPPWPRAEGAALERLSAAPPGADPIRDEDVKPFAALAALRKNGGETEKKD